MLDVFRDVWLGIAHLDLCFGTVLKVRQRMLAARLGGADDALASGRAPSTYPFP